jgi:hypothetical protein
LDEEKKMKKKNAKYRTYLGRCERSPLGCVQGIGFYETNTLSIGYFQGILNTDTRLSRFLAGYSKKKSRTNR